MTADGNIQVSGGICFRPASHKTDHHDHERRIYIGPRGQDILRPWLKRDPEAYCFSPAEAVEARNERRRRARKSPLTPSQEKRKRKASPKRKPGEKYAKHSYRNAIGQACKKAGVPKWKPNQLRHTQGTFIRQKFGLEASQVVLGNSDPQTTLTYAEKNFELAKRIMLEVG